MSYMNRNKKGDILSAQGEQNEDHKECLKSDASASLFKQKEETNKIRQSLSGSDAEMVRVIDDLIHLRIEKQVFVFTELPEAVQKKLNSRSKLRTEINPLEGLIGESDNIF